MKRYAKWILIPAVILAAITAMIIVPRSMVEKQLKKLGYSNEAAKVIIERQLTQEILDNKYYSGYLDACFADGRVEEDYLFLYAIRDTDHPLSAEDLNLCARLLDFGYEKRQVTELFRNLSFFEITPLLVFDYQYDLIYYITDCVQHRDTNDTMSFTLTKSYVTPYLITKAADLSRDMDIYVSKNVYLPEDYQAQELTELPLAYAVNGQSLRPEAENAFRQFAASGSAAGAPFYAVSSFRSYEELQKIYDQVKGTGTAAAADRAVFRAGYSEHQTGLAINIAATERNKDYTETVASKWASAHCYEYGWIERYPTAKADITQVRDEPDHFRYVGKEMALAIKQSRLTFDEFYALYLNAWEDESLKPAETVLGKLAWYDLPKQEDTDTEDKPQK